MTVICLTRKHHSTGSFCAEGWLKPKIGLRDSTQALSGEPLAIALNTGEDGIRSRAALIGAGAEPQSNTFSSNVDTQPMAARINGRRSRVLFSMRDSDNAQTGPSLVSAGA
jgi:hypothetical protein